MTKLLSFTLNKSRSRWTTTRHTRRPKVQNLRYTTLIGLVVSFFAVGCGSDNNKENNGTTPTNNNGTAACEELPVCKSSSVVAQCGEEYDCAGDLPGAYCAERDASIGAECLAADGGACSTGWPIDSAMVLCAEPGSACLMGPDSGTCATGYGACDADSFDIQCSGDHLLMSCSAAGSLLALDCQAWNGTCGDLGLGDGTWCIVPEGSPCDDVLFVCEDGFECVEDSGHVECVPKAE